MEPTLATPDLDTEQEIDAALDQPWSVVLYDDDVNTCEFVTFVLQRVLHVDAVQAEALMWQVHNTGKSRLTTCPRSEAEKIVVELVTYTLNARLEPAA
jgi:ATP-dependent Clp protease adaptor protein ClpS